jgi:hypothetical protein
MPRYLPAAAWYMPIFVMCGFSALRAEKPHIIEIQYRSAEGSSRQLRKS